MKKLLRVLLMLSLSFLAISGSIAPLSGVAHADASASAGGDFGGSGGSPR